MALLTLFGVIALLIAWSGARAIQGNFELQKRIATLEQKNSNQKLENDNLRLKNQYLKTDEYLELTARRVFGKAAPGETVVIIPKDVALRHTKERQTKDPKPKVNLHKPRWQQNLESWRTFLFAE